MRSIESLMAELNSQLMRTGWQVIEVPEKLTGRSYFLGDAVIAVEHQGDMFTATGYVRLEPLAAAGGYNALTGYTGPDPDVVTSFVVRMVGAQLHVTEYGADHLTETVRKDTVELQSLDAFRERLVARTQAEVARHLATSRC